MAEKEINANNQISEDKGIVTTIKDILKEWLGNAQKSPSKLWIIAFIIIACWAISPKVFKGVIDEILQALGSAYKIGEGLVLRGKRWFNNKATNIYEIIVGTLQNYFDETRLHNWRRAFWVYLIGCFGLMILGLITYSWLLTFIGAFGLFLPVHLLNWLINCFTTEKNRNLRSMTEALSTICRLVYIFAIAWLLHLGWGFNLTILSVLGLALLGMGFRKKVMNFWRPAFRLSAFAVGIAIMAAIFMRHGLVYQNWAYYRYQIDKISPQVPNEEPTAIMELGEEAIFYIADTSKHTMAADTTLPAGTRVEALKGQTLEDADGRTFIGVYVRWGKVEKKYFTNKSNLTEPTKKKKNDSSQLPESYQNTSYPGASSGLSPTTAYFAGHPYSLGQCQVTQTSDGYQITAPAGPCLAANTGIQVKAGEKIFFNVSGSVNGSINSQDGACQWVEAQGWGYQPIFLNGRPLICPQANFMEVVGHITDETGRVLASFPLRSEVVMPANGFFITGSNEPLTNCCGQLYNAASDNEGNYIVKMTVYSSTIT